MDASGAARFNFESRDAKAGGFAGGDIDEFVRKPFEPSQVKRIRALVYEDRFLAGLEFYNKQGVKLLGCIAKIKKAAAYCWQEFELKDGERLLGVRSTRATANGVGTMSHCKPVLILGSKY